MMANSNTGMILAVHILALRFAAALAGMVRSGTLYYRCICIAAIVVRRRLWATFLAERVDDKLAKVRRVLSERSRNWDRPRPDCGLLGRDKTIVIGSCQA